MSSANINAKIKKGLKTAVNKTGSTNSELVYLIESVRRGGSTPIDPNRVMLNKILLVDAIFNNYEAKTLDANILAGDRRLISNSEVAIKQGDEIKQGRLSYVVVNVDIKAPTSDVLVYISQVRLK